jgi:hypothetical protein
MIKAANPSVAAKDSPRVIKKVSRRLFIKAVTYAPRGNIQTQHD